MNFTDTMIRPYANEIAQDEIADVRFLRQVPGIVTVAQSAIDTSGTDPNGAFPNAARAACLVGPGIVLTPLRRTGPSCPVASSSRMTTARPTN
ncbi:hypothetical protein HZ989_05395 [Brevundimonas sp. AJA228-03]|uniref:hypothetical protein n=1 Tax=Brevundimonas sp. AJA228-03 TaxID=2752515 RepID=UPI001AE02AEB|nr:hypothetical protein [Brevundimonas sp. AJA228-03]QTN20498.1 hypothetical protein HZ989_05395 [Brevundimonas sp. AJA228-03]